MNEVATLTEQVQANPVLVLVDSEKFDRFYEEMKRETDAHVPDLTTETGRKTIASLAYKVARTKTAIDEAGKKLNEEARARINLVDEARRKIREQLDALKDEVRKPLTDWERAEAARIENAQATIRHIRECGDGRIGGEDQPFGVLFHELDEKVVIDASFGEYEEIARNALVAAREKLEIRLEAHKRAEADRIELERMRAEAEARAEAERVAAEKKAEAERVARAKAEEEAKIEAAKKAAEEVARQEAERIARQEREAQQRAHEAAIEAERKRADEAERIQRERAAEEARIAAEQEARNRDRAHRSKVMSDAKVALIDAAGITEDQAKLAVLAIVGGNIPHCIITF